MTNEESSMKSRLITLLLALATAGCSTMSTVLAPNTPITPQSGKPVPAERIYQRELTVPSPGRTAKVSFLRDAGFLGGGCTHKILVDGQIVFAIRSGEYQTLHLAPGRYLFGLEIERGICPEFSSSHSLVLSDGAEDTYRILIPPLYNPLMGSIALPGSPRVERIGASTEGKVPGESYYAPLGNFVLPLDRGNIRIQDNNDARSGIVSVLDDMGNNHGITYAGLPANAEAVLSDPAKRDPAYRGFVHDYVLPTYFRPISAQSKIVHEEFLSSGLDRAFFAVAVIPEASSAMDAKTGKRWDSVRALLVFYNNNFMYMLHSEINTVFGPVNAASLTNKDMEAARKKMQRM